MQYFSWRGTSFFSIKFFGHESVNPDGQYSKKNGTAEDSKLDNRLMMDLSQQFCLPLVAISADADKCYDRINHIIMSLLLLTLTREQGPIWSVLRPIQQMKFYQQTGRGDSSTYMGGRAESNSLQGLCQGNGAALACWIMVSLLMMSVFCREGHLSTLTSSITGQTIKFMGEIYINNTIS